MSEDARKAVEEIRSICDEREAARCKAPVKVEVGHEPDQVSDHTEGAGVERSAPAPGQPSPAMTRKERIEQIMVRMLVTNFDEDGVPDGISDWLLERAYRTAENVVDFIDRATEKGGAGG